MSKRVDEYVQVHEVSALKKNLSNSNYLILEAINKTNVIKELVQEKEEAIRLAKDIAKSLIPEVQILTSYLRNEEVQLPEEIYTHPHHKASQPVKASKHKEKEHHEHHEKAKTVNLSEEGKTLLELKKNLAKIRRQLNE